MGGPGSGSWYRWGPTKRRVEECDSVDTAVLRRRGWLRPGAISTGPLTWTYRPGAATSQITLTTDLSNPECPLARLSYTLSGERLTYPVELEATQPHYGGVRWWFLCPMRPRGVPCGRRVRKLYRSGHCFGCRQCHDLTYKSRQEHDARVSRLMKSPELLAAILRDGGPGFPLLAIKAALTLERRGQLP